MKVLLIGSGGREHAIAWKLKQSPLLDKLYIAPGNPGTAQLGENLPVSADQIEKLCGFALEREIDLTIVGPEAPLAAGIVDRFKASGLLITGPTRAAARLETSKVWAKEFMLRQGIPTAAFEVFDHPEEAEAALKEGRFSFPTVVKADGLAAGKGVFVCSRLEQSVDAVRLVMRQKQFGAAGDRLLIEECLQGEEASFMLFTDGSRVLPMVPSQDHKAILEGGRGPNTGGMGAYSMDTILSAGLRRRILDEIVEPTLQGMKEEGVPYCGILYVGLMLTRSGPQVLEFNVRFGDPEAQVVLPRMKSDLLELLAGLAGGRLRGQTVEWDDNTAVCVVVASKGYPASYQKGKEISGLEMAAEAKDTVLFHAGTAVVEGKTVTDGGRVLGLTARAPSLEAAVMRAYEGVNKLYFEGMYYRRDIASRGIDKAGETLQ
ncbi:MAG: phosphoribosylamine--glycine ligase [Acidobacteriota bacterium]